MAVLTAASIKSSKSGFSVCAFSFICFMLAQHRRVSVPAPPGATGFATQEKSADRTLWSEGGIDEIYRFLECSDYHASDIALKAPDASFWRLLHETYQESTRLPSDVVVSSPYHYPQHELIPPVPQQEQTSAYPVEVKETTYNGEQDIGVFATRDIPKGMLVWKSTHTARFDTGKSFRAFVRALPVPQACDVLDWAYPRYLGSKPVVCVDLYFGSLLGICDVETECNLQISRGNYDTALGCGAEFYASRDIAAGELLMMDHFPQDAEALVPLGLA